MENFMNGHFKSDRTKIVLCFFLTKVNIWKFSRIILINFSPKFLTNSSLSFIIHIPDPYFVHAINSSLVNFTNDIIFFPL